MSKKELTSPLFSPKFFNVSSAIGLLKGGNIISQVKRAFLLVADRIPRALSESNLKSKSSFSNGIKKKNKLYAYK